MMQDNRLLPLTPETLDRPLRDLAQPAQVVSSAPAQEPAHLREYLAVVLKRKWLILSLMVVVTSLVSIQMYRQPSVYEAQATVQIEQKSKSVVSTGKGGDLVIRSNDPTYWNTQLQKLKTQKLARQVILRLGLQDNPNFLGTYRGTGIIAGLKRIVTREKPQQKPQQEAGSVPVVSDSDTGDDVSPEMAVKLEPFEDALRDNLVITPIDRTNLVEIHFTHTDQQIAANVVNMLASVFRENDIESETVASRKAGEVLANTIIDLQKEIQENEAKRLAYQKARDLPLGTKAGQDLTAVQLTTYSTQMQAAEQKRKQAEAEYKAALQTQTADGVWAIPAVQSNKNVQRLREKISELEEQRRALLVTYTTEWPAVKKIDEQLKRLNEELKETPKEIIAGLRTGYESALKEEESSKQSYFGSRGRANAQSIDERGLADLDQKIETDRQNLNLYMQRQNELKVTSYDNAAGNVSMVEEARVPREPIGPARGRNIAIALMLSLGVGIGLAFLLDYLDDTLKSVEDVDRHLHLPTLALIPAPREQRRLLARGGAASAPGNTTTALALIDDARSPVAEAYRHLRTSLLLSSAGQPPRTVLVTSSQPSEGKTTTVVNIATMLAQTGADVLVLDCDLRRPRVHTHFGISNPRGVTNYLSGDANIGDLVQSPKGMPENLKVITSGPVPPNAAELLGSDEMRKLLYVLSESFTHIVIDSPPAISFTDASILSTMVDGVMLVVHGGRSSRAVVRRAKQQLQDVGAHIFGIVLNNVKLEGMDYYYSGYYTGYYSDEESPEGAETAAAGTGGRAS
jgi:polysaccharide biosynthesis transport protein